MHSNFYFSPIIPFLSQATHLILSVALFWKRKIYTKYQWQSLFKKHLQILHIAAHRFRGSLIPPVWAAGSSRYCSISVLFCRKLSNCATYRFIKPGEGCAELQLRLQLRRDPSRDSFSSWELFPSMTADRCIVVLWVWCICCHRHQERRWRIERHWCRKLSR